MEQNIDFWNARKILLKAVGPVGTERVELSRSGGRVLAEDLEALENVPPFDRSPYDGFAFRAADTASARKDAPVTLRILEEIPAGAVPHKEVTEGTASKVLTGSPIPHGADAVIMYEKTCYDQHHVTIDFPIESGANIVRAGEDICKGTILGKHGEQIDPGLAGTMAAQGIANPLVYRIPKVAILSTGSELVEASAKPGPGKIRNSNRYMLEAALKAVGCEPVYYGIVEDRADDICARLCQALERCDAVITTGGVSVGDYDVTAEAMKMAGGEILFQGVELKPGMACAYSIYEGKMLCGLSGNPASAMTNFYAVALPALRRLAGHSKLEPEEFDVTLLDGYPAASRVTRLLRGQLRLKEGKVCMSLASGQGNVVISSSIGCNVMAIVPAGSGPVPAGSTLKGFLL